MKTPSVNHFLYKNQIRQQKKTPLLMYSTLTRDRSGPKWRRLLLCSTFAWARIVPKWRRYLFYSGFTMARSGPKQNSTWYTLRSQKPDQARNEASWYPLPLQGPNQTQNKDIITAARSGPKWIRPLICTPFKREGRGPKWRRFLLFSTAQEANQTQNDVAAVILFLYKSQIRHQK